MFGMCYGKFVMLEYLGCLVFFVIHVKRVVFRACCVGLLSIAFSIVLTLI